MFHFIWVQKSDIRQPLIWAGILAVLLILRIPRVRSRAVTFRTSRRAGGEVCPAEASRGQRAGSAGRDLGRATKQRSCKRGVLATPFLYILG